MSLGQLVVLSGVPDLTCLQEEFSKIDIQHRVRLGCLNSLDHLGHSREGFSCPIKLPGFK